MWGIEDAQRYKYGAGLSIDLKRIPLLQSLQMQKSQNSGHRFKSSLSFQLYVQFNVQVSKFIISFRN